MSAAQDKPEPDLAREVTAFLRANPGWLAEQPALYRALHPPARVHGDRLADHMAAMLQAERAHAAAMAERADDVLAAGRAAAGLAQRVQAAVLALIRNPDPADCVAAEMPGILAIDVATLCVEPPSVRGARAVAASVVERLLGARDVMFRAQPSDTHLLYAEAAPLARYDALVRVPLAGAQALLALAARDHHALDPAQGAGALAFLGRAVAAALAR